MSPPLFAYPQPPAWLRKLRCLQLQAPLIKDDQKPASLTLSNHLGYHLAPHIFQQTQPLTSALAHLAQGPAAVAHSCDLLERLQAQPVSPPVLEIHCGQIDNLSDRQYALSTNYNPNIHLHKLLHFDTPTTFRYNRHTRLI